nr:PREDICTED: uncharacterized protein LOC109042839 [Bemisia tabaci]
MYPNTRNFRNHRPIIFNVRGQNPHGPRQNLVPNIPEQDVPPHLNQQVNMFVPNQLVPNEQPSPGLASVDERRFVLINHGHQSTSNLSAPPGFGSVQPNLGSSSSNDSSHMPYDALQVNHNVFNASPFDFQSQQNGFQHVNHANLASGPPPPAFQQSPSNVPSDQNLLLQELRNLSLSVTAQIENIKAEIPVIVQRELGQTSANRSGTCNSPVHPLSRATSSSSLASINPVTQNASSSSKRKTPFNLKALKELPKFNGNLDPVHPKEFISNVKCFRETQYASDDDLWYGMNSLLKDSALTWYQVYREEFRGDFEKFCTELVKYFWSKGLQNKLRSAILAPPQVEPTPGTYANYFLNYVKHAKYLDIPLDSSTVIAAISYHFPQNVQVALAQSNSETNDEVIATLQIFDQLSVKPRQGAVKSSSQQIPPGNQKANQQVFNQRSHVHQVNFDFSVPPPAAYEPLTSDQSDPQA